MDNASTPDVGMQMINIVNSSSDPGIMHLCLLIDSVEAVLDIFNRLLEIAHRRDITDELHVENIDENSMTLSIEKHGIKHFCTISWASLLHPESPVKFSLSPF
jgi:hypothetical protein